MLFHINGAGTFNPSGVHELLCGMHVAQTFALIKDSAELEDVKLYVNGSGGDVMHQSAGLIIVRRHVRKVSRYQKG
jgi:hypothetical protein